MFSGLVVGVSTSSLRLSHPTIDRIPPERPQGWVGGSKGVTEDFPVDGGRQPCLFPPTSVSGEGREGETWTESVVAGGIEVETEEPSFSSPEGRWEGS